MLPFRRNQEDAALAGPLETKEREHDEDFDLLSLVAEDLLAAVEKKDVKRLRAALEAFCDHIQDLDAASDAAMENHE